MFFAKLESGVLSYAPLNLKTPQGNIILNFNKSEILARSYGFKEVIDTPPKYDDRIEYIIISGYTEKEESIIINYTIKLIDSIIQEQPVESDIERLERTNTELETALAEMYELLLNRG